MKKESRCQVPPSGSLTIVQGIRHTELRDEEELLKSIRRERRIRPKTPPKLSEESRKKVADAERALADISDLAFVDPNPFYWVILDSFANAS